MTTLSLAMIVRNEATRLGHCLDSIQGLVDELVIVDTGSTDGTPGLAQARGAALVQFPWRDDFSAARNESLRHCHGDWVLVLDADEAIDPLDHDCIRAALDQDRSQAFRLILRNYFAGGGETVQGVATRVNDTAYSEGSRFTHFSDGKAVRLCRRHPDLQFRGRIHELLEPYFLARGLPVEDLNAVIHHFGKADRLREEQKKVYYLELAQRSAQEGPGDLQLQFNLLQQAMAAQAWSLVLEAAGACLNLAGGEVFQPLALLGAGMALQSAGRHAEALTYLERLVAGARDHAQGHTRRAVSLAALGRLEEARQALGMAIQVQPGFIVPYVNLAELEDQTGQPGAARSALLAGLASNPGDPQLFHALVQLAISHGDLEQAVREAKRAIERCPAGGQGVWHRLVAFQLLREGAPEQAIKVLERGLQAFPGQEDLLRLRALAAPPSSI
jgi:Flp pilus assembly protein TadD